MAIVLVASLGTAASVRAAPAPEDLPPGIVVLVAEAPAGAGRITVAEFRHNLEIAAALKNLDSPPRPGQAGYAGLKEEVVDSLLEAAWLRGQALEWGIIITRRQVKRTLVQLRRESFKSQAEYRAFLRENHFTRRDIYERAELQILSIRAQKRLEAQIDPQASKAEEQRFFRKFVREFTQRWRDRTVCAPEYATQRCSNGPNVV